MMQTALHILGLVLLAIGGVLLAISAWGLHVLPDALSRQHATTKAATLALSAMCVGAFLLQTNWDWGLRLGIVLVYLMLTLPLASHMMARAAVTEIDSQQP